MVGFPNFLGPYPNLSYFFSNEILRYHVYQDPTYDLHEFNFEKDVPDTYHVAAVMNATDPNLWPFKSHGGKIILYHGYADPLVNPTRTVQYYEDVQQTMGKKRADDVARLFLLPGVSHCAGGVGPDTADWITNLEKWVEDGEAPDEITAYQLDVTGQVVRTRPLCPYPKVAKYKGTGSTDDAANFTCQEP
jgi:feruloyl esterase